MLAQPGTHKGWPAEKVVKVVGTLLRVDKTVIGKTARQLRELMQTQRVSKEAMRSVPYIPLPAIADPTADNDEEPDDDEPRLYLFQEKEGEANYELTFSTYMDFGKQRIMLNDGDSNLYDSHSADIYASAVAAESAKGGWGKLSKHETFPHKGLDTFLKEYNGWQADNRSKMAIDR